MTQIKSWPMIGEDFNGNQHFYEQPAYTKGEAGRKLAANHGNLVRAYINLEKLQGKPGTPKKLVWSRKGYEEEAGGGFGIMATAMTQSRIDVAAMLVKDLAKRGLQVVFDQMEDGSIAVFIKGKGATDDDRRSIEENKDSVIAYLKQQEDVVTDEQESDAAQELTQGKLSLRETIRRILPDLPPEFGLADIQTQLRKWKDDELADDVKCIHNLMYWVVAEGYAERIKRGHYRLLEKGTLRRSNAPPSPETAATPKLDTAPAIAPLPPPPPPQLELAAPPSAPASQESTAATTTSLFTLPLQDSVNVQTALIRLVAELGSGGIDESVLDSWSKSIDGLETQLISAVDNAIGPMRDMIQRVRQSNARKSLLLQAFASLEK